MHSPAPWKIIVAGNQWGISAKGAKPRDGEPDLASGSQLAERWREDAAMILAAPKMLAALKAALPHIADPDAKKAAAAAIRAAEKPVDA